MHYWDRTVPSAGYYSPGQATGWHLQSGGAWLGCYYHYLRREQRRSMRLVRSLLRIFSYCFSLDDVLTGGDGRLSPRRRARMWSWAWPWRGSGRAGRHWSSGRCRGNCCRGRWGRTLCGCVKNGTESAYCSSTVCLRKGNIIQILVCATFLADPGVASVARPKDCAQLAYSCSVRSICETDSQKCLRGATTLADPGVTSICRPENRPLLAYNGSYVGICKPDSSKLRICSAVLRNPVLTAVGSSENHAFSCNATNDCPSIDIGEISSKQATSCAAGLRDPALSAIGRSENCPVKETNNCSVIFVGKLNSIKPVSRVARLLNPAVATVCCS